MTLNIVLLGQFKLQADNRLLDLPSRPAQSLLAYLVLNAGVTHRRERLAGLLWPDATESNSRSYLRQALWRIRKTLESGELNWQDYLQINEISVTFDSQADYILDVDRLLKPAQQLTVDELAAITGAYQGELLPGFHDEWLVMERERIQAVYLQRMKMLVEGLVGSGRWEDAIESAEQWIRMGHAPEAAFRALMRAYAGLGDQGMISATHQRCVESLERELGVEPSLETGELYAQLRRHDARSRTAAVAGRRPAFLDERPEGETERSVFVAREAELTQLDSRLEQALSGQGQVVFITGEAGSGKTALMNAFATRAQATYPELVMGGGNCNAHTGFGDPYLPFREILELLTGDVESRWTAGSITHEHAWRLWQTVPLTARALVEAGPGLVETFIPGRPLLDRVAACVPAGSEWLTRLERVVDQWVPVQAVPGLQQSDLFVQYTRVMQQVARQAPLLLQVDDLQWADPGSISLLFFLARHLAGNRILLLGAYRSEDVAIGRGGERHPLAPVLNELQRAAGDITVNVDQAASSRFVDAFLDSEPNCLGPSFRKMLSRQTDGQPLFTVELLRGMQERGDLVLNDSGQWTEGQALDWEKLPARVEAVVAERIERLAAPLQSALRVASVEGELFTAEVVARVLGLDPGGLVQNVSRELDHQHRLISSQSITRLNGGLLSRYRFRHILFQKYLYNDLDEVERVHLHEQVGRALEELFSTREQIATITPQLARHFREADISEKAIYYLLEAGEKAVLVSAYEEAMAHLTQALSLLKTLPPTAERAEQEIRLQIALGMAQSRRIPGPEWQVAYMRARDLSLQTGQTVHLSQIMGELSIVHYVRADHQRARELAEEALGLAKQTGVPLVEALGAWYLSFVLFYMGRFEAAAEHLAKIVTFYEEQKRPDLFIALRGSDVASSALAYYACTLWCLGYPDQALQRSRQALDVANQFAHPFSTAEAICYAGCLFNALRGETAELKQHAEQMVRLAGEGGFTGWMASATQFHGQALIEEGAVNEGTVLTRQGMVANEAIGLRIHLPESLSALALAYDKSGRAQEALAMLDEALDFVEETDSRYKEAELHRLRADFLLRQGGAAEADLHKALAVARQQNAKMWELRAATSLARLWQEQGRAAEAAELVRGVYGWFTEGFDTPDLLAAQALLSDLT
jgi:DNA-binding SARP family transcriptional activator/predicted ATPase